MPRKDVRFNAKYVKNTANKRKDDKVQGEEIGNGTILNKHIADGAISSNQLQTISIPQPFHCASHLSGTMDGNRWIRVAQLQNRSAVEFWVLVTVSGHHNLAKFVGTYCFLGSGSPGITFSMVSNARFGNGFTNVRLVYKGTYDIIYFEIFLPQQAFVSVGQSSAFGATVSEFSNITLVEGSVPTGYTKFPNNPSAEINFGSYDSGILTI